MERVEQIRLACTLLDRIRAYLLRYEVRTWPDILAEWQTMLSGVRTDVEASAVFSHVHEGLWGMGRLADVVISPEAGHPVTVDRDHLKSVNDEFLSLVQQLSDAVRIRVAPDDQSVR